MAGKVIQRGDLDGDGVVTTFIVGNTANYYFPTASSIDIRDGCILVKDGDGKVLSAFNSDQWGSAVAAGTEVHVESHDEDDDVARSMDLDLRD